MWAVELVSDRAARAPGEEKVAQLARCCYGRSLVTITAWMYGNVMRMLMPLVVTDDEIEESLDVMKAARGEHRAMLGRRAPAFFASSSK